MKVGENDHTGDLRNEPGRLALQHGVKLKSYDTKSLPNTNVATFHGQEDRLKKMLHRYTGGDKQEAGRIWDTQSSKLDESEKGFYRDNQSIGKEEKMDRIASFLSIAGNSTKELGSLLKSLVDADQMKYHGTDDKMIAYHIGTHPAFKPILQVKRLGMGASDLTADSKNKIQELVKYARQLVDFNYDFWHAVLHPRKK